MKRTLLFPTNAEPNILPLFLFGTLVIFLQLDSYLLMTAWGISAGLLFIDKSMRFFVLITLTFGIGFFFYGYVNSQWIAEMTLEEMRIIINRLSLIVLIIPLISISFIYRLPFMSYWQKPQWGESVRIPFIWSGFRRTKVSTFLVIAMIINLITFMPFVINTSWAYIQEIWRFLLVFSILNSVLEEIIWRGVLLSRFSECFGNRWAVLITSIGFGLQHYSLGFSWISCLLFSVGGFFFGAITVRSNSIIPAVIWHMLLNFLMVISGMLVD
ncbi:CPBP family intramembrane metalloprotease [Gracilibacillus salitolerans]|uniref:CPBP family intramembrane metalloprotease n=1 Tax=Gracilibacillus salitolerans TaxID=2663022 RepID=A0A5Q2TRK6_9BACI|nr:type II CAAX endopeptidase family protein [Gracilibacillus salitolerans]QGH36742.1 CPBP family intramembrane metalloprotease [Gracilibacillus salitolerans]